MRIAIPVDNGCLSAHFGHCSEFAIVEVDPEAGAITGRETLSAPPHQPGLLPKWLAERGVNLVIAGGMGQRAKELFALNRIEVVTGAPAEPPEKLVLDYLSGSLETGPNLCDH
jgi:predicted Fe-Mo cluster-binding NifX family protein